MHINNQKQNFKSLSHISTPARQFYNANATIPTLVIETGVTLGRAFEAKKRGGIIEATDRLVEQGVSAIVWIYGVNFLKKIGDFISQKLLKIKDFNFDIGFDELRNPTKYINKKALCAKAGNVLISVALATYFIGAILPKINNKILKVLLKKQEKDKDQKTDNIKPLSFSEFQQKTKRNNISFTSLSNLVVNGAHILENNSTARLFITDTGVIAGRYKNAPNKYRKIEGLIRDISSIYLYLYARKHLNALINKLIKNTDIDPAAVEKTVEMLSQKLKQEGAKDAEGFLNDALKKASDSDIEKLKALFKNKKTITTQEFEKEFSSCAQRAIDMSKMQYIEEGKTGILSYRQAHDALSGGWACDSGFLKETYDKVFNKDISDKLSFVSRKNLDSTRDSIDKFIAQIYRKAKKQGSIVDEEFIKKVAKNNITKNFIINIFATGVSMFALGILIPKLQYAISKKLFKESKFHAEEE